MVNVDEVQLARQTVQSLTQLFQINRIIYVDDYFEEQFEVETIIGWLDEIQDDALSKIESLFEGIPLRADRDIWARALRSFWEKLSPRKQKDVAISVATVIGKNLSQDYKVANKLPEYFPDGVQVLLVSPTQWIEQKEQFLETVSPQAKILCLFDQDLSGAKGFSVDGNGSRSGIGLLQEIVQRGMQSLVVCCLLTHTITSLEGEISAWRELAEPNGLKITDFLPLAKLRLTTDESPHLFVDGIKKAMLNIFCDTWKRFAIDIIDRSNKSALDSIRNIDVYDFDHMVFQASFNEGIWELETLVRLFQIFQRDEIRNLFLGTQNADELNELIGNSRSISNVKVAINGGPEFPKIRPIRRKELFESASLIQHTPIEVGDIFIDLQNKTTFILLAQPCDLMVRSTGEFEGKRSNEHLLVSLVPFQPLTVKDYRKKPPYHWKTHTVFNYYYSDTDDVAEVCFTKGEFYDVDLLDFAILDPNGFCKLDLNALQTIPVHCTNGWKKRLVTVIQKFQEKRSRLDRILEHLDQIKGQPVYDSICEETPMITKFYSAGIFNIGLQRIGRYRHPGSARLLKAYMQYLSRDADDVDFAKEIKQTQGV